MPINLGTADSKLSGITDPHSIRLLGSEVTVQKIFSDTTNLPLIRAVLFTCPDLVLQPYLVHEIVDELVIDFPP